MQFTKLSRIALLTPAFVASLSASAATFTVTPSTVSNDYSGVITFQMDGLTPGETVNVVQFYDFNGNSKVDGADFGVRSDAITDGHLPTIGGVTDPNVMGDDDAKADGSIRSTLRFSAAPDLARGVGHYVFRFSSPSNHFAAVDVPFTVANAAYGQKVQGSVRCDGTNVPNAGVAVVQVVAGRIKPVVGGSADSSGQYALSAPADSYYVIAFWPGCVMDFKTAPRLALTAGTILTTNVSLLPANTRLSGQLVDNNTSGSPALPYAQVTLFTSDHLFTISVTDSNANFAVPVTPGVWTVRPRWQNAAAREYLAPEPGSYTEPSFDTTGGALAGANVPLKKATTLVYGQVQDDSSNSIGGIHLSANLDGGGFDGNTISDTNGSYAMALDGGAGYLNVEELTAPPASTYIWSGSYIAVNDGQALSHNVVGHRATAHFRGQIVTDMGTAVADFPFFANNNTGGTSLGTTDTNGMFDLPVFAGNWQLYPDSGAAQQRGLIFAPYSFQVTDGVDQTNTLIVHRATGSVSGSVRDNTNGIVTSLTITLDNNATGTSLSAYPDYNGNYSVPVFDGTWTASLNAYDLLARGYNPVNPITVAIPPSNGVANFTLVSLGAAEGAPQITSASLPDAVMGQPYTQVLNITNAQEPFTWSVTTGALPNGITLDSDLGVISGTPTQLGSSTFTVQVADQRGSNAVASLTLKVVGAAPKPPTLTAAAAPHSITFQVQVNGLTGKNYTLEASADLVHWSDVGTTNAPANVFTMQDTGATGSTRFYRVRTTGTP